MEPVTWTAVVVADTALKRIPTGWNRPLRFHWQFPPTRP